LAVGFRNLNPTYNLMVLVGDASQLNGYWEIKRFPLEKLSSMYEIQTLVVSPLTEKLNQLGKN